MAYYSDKIPLAIGFSLTGWLPMHCAYWNFDTIKMFFHDQKPNADIHE